MNLRKASLLLKLSIILSSAFLGACASYQTKVDKARTEIQKRNNDEAIKILQPLADQQNDDQLVYMLDYATVLQQSGQYKESAKYLQKSEKLSDIQDYFSVSREAGSLLLSEGMVQYKGDNFEKVIINAINSINYLMMNDLDGALVEVRRLNEKLYKFKYEAKKDYEQNPFGFYLSAIIWEADHRYDDAYIDYKKAYDLVPDYEPLHSDLVRAAQKARRSEDVDKWKQKFSDIKIDPETKDSGELILIYQQGWGPRKYPRPGAPRFPKLFPVHSHTQKAKLNIEGIGSYDSSAIFSVQDVAIKTLDDDYAALVAKRLAGIATKAVVSDQIRQKNKLLGDLTYIALNVADQADLRQWSTLPESFHIVRKVLKAGTYKVKVQGLSSGNIPTGEESQLMDVQINPGKKSFITWRSFQ